MAELADRELIAQMGAEAKRNSGLYDWKHKGDVIREVLEDSFFMDWILRQ
jgi:hypothetical protein